MSQEDKKGRQKPAESIAASGKRPMGFGGGTSGDEGAPGS